MSAAAGLSAGSRIADLPYPQRPFDSRDARPQPRLLPQLCRRLFRPGAIRLVFPHRNPVLNQRQNPSEAVWLSRARGLMRIPSPNL